MSSETYQELLKRIEWKTKRREILFRDHYECQYCYTKQRLEVHHAYYDFKLKPWEYPNDSLLTLCRDCHQEETDLIEDRKWINKRKGSGFKSAKEIIEGWKNG